MLGNTSTTKKQRFLQCQACKDSHVYNSPIDALNHLHDVHMDCEAADRKDHLHDDPCSVWVAELNTPSIKEENVRIQDAEDFMRALVDVSGLLNEIQWLVAATAQGVQNKVPARPHLPASLVHAFEYLISSYVCTSTYLSRSNHEDNRTITSQSRKSRLKLERLNTRCIELRLNVVSKLTNAKRDILVDGTPDGHEDTLGIRAVDSEFLMAAVITTMQNRSFKVPSREETTSMHAVGTSSNIVHMYKEYNKQIHLEMSRRPQKRLLLAIDEQTQEVDFLRELTLDQKDMFNSLWNEPDDSAHDFADQQFQILKKRLNEFETLMHAASDLKDRVGQMIGIIEEDHGKAIRVFTVVTLFFLPM